MIKVPVLRKFNFDDIIGTLEIDETQLPANFNFVFSLGYSVTEHELYCVSLMTDEEYLAYLNSGRQCSKAGE